MKWIIFIHSILIFFMMVCIPSCVNSHGSVQDFEIKSINSPSEIDRNLANKILFLEKNVNDQSIIAMISLDYSSYNVFVLPDEANNLVLSHDNKWLTYVRSEQLGKISPHSIYIYDIDSNREKRIAGWYEDILDIWLMNPSFSYDDFLVIFTVTWFETNHIGLAVVDISNGNVDILKTNRPIAYGPKYSPDGTEIIVNCPGFDVFTNEVGYQICLFDSNGKYLSHLTNCGDYNSSYQFTPDGRKIVYSEAETGGPFNLFNKQVDRLIVMDANGMNKRELISWDVRNIGFSDDSLKVFFQGRSNPKNSWGIYIINIDGSNLRHLTYFDEFLKEWYSDIEKY